MTDAPTTRIEKRFNVGCMLMGLGLAIGPVIYFLTIWLVEPTVGFVPPTFSSPDVTPESLAFGPAGERLALADREGNVAVWNIRTGRAEFHVRRQVERMDQPPVVDLAPDGSQIAAGFADGEIAVWSLTDAEQRWNAREHESAIREIRWTVPPDPRLLTFDNVGNLVVSNPLTGSVVSKSRLDSASDDVIESEHQVGIYSAPDDSSNFFGAWVSDDGEMFLTIVKPERRDIPLEIPAATQLKREHLAFAPGAASLYVAGQFDGKNAGVLYVVDPDTGLIKSEVPFGRPDEDLSLLSVAVSPDGKVVAVGLSDGVHLFNVDEPWRLRPWPRDPAKLQAVSE